jgi:hypothetical protein
MCKVKENEDMAKHSHRVFEMYDFRDEAVRALTPKAARHDTEAINSEFWNFKCLAASRSANLMHVGFKQDQFLKEDIVSDLRKDFAQLTDKLAIGSKILLDFTGLNSFSPASIDTLVSFNKNLRHKGSRIVLCCLDSTVRDSFFPPADEDPIHGKNASVHNK